MAFKVIGTPPKRLAANITPKLAAKYEAGLRDKTGPEAVALAKKYAKEKYITDRPQHRRRSNLHYSNNFYVKVRPGARNSGFGAMPVMEFRNRAPHAIFLEKGTRPHRIVAHNKYLVFRFGTKQASAYGVGGKRFRGKAVNHPGQKASNIGRRAVTTALRRTFPP